jgi:uncharacterized protein YbjT (DUF2867 family)
MSSGAAAESMVGGDVERASILLTGASGFVGGALLPALTEGGSIRCLVRNASRLGDSYRSLAVEADLSDAESLAPVLEGMDEVYYLVHSMEPGGGQGFAERDRIAAENYVRVARDAGVRRTIYLGGIGADDDSSEHLASRREVEGLLADAGPELVVLRASMIVGAGSASFGTLVDIVRRLPVLAMPTWRDRCTQPIAIADVVACLVEARNVPPGAYEIAGPDALTFEKMTEVIADLLGETHRSVPLPFSSPRLEAAAASLVTGEDRELLEPLMAGLDGDLSVRDNSVREVFGVEPTPFREAARQAIAAAPDPG